MKAEARTDVVIVGAGPAALFAVFQLGLYGLRCTLIDSLDRAGGQCAVLYPDKPIYDIPALPAVDGLELTARLLAQAAPFDPAFLFSKTVTSIDPCGDEGFVTTMRDGATIASRVVVIATGLGTFVPADGGEPSLTAGPAGEWPLQRQSGGLSVDTERFETSRPGIFAIGDACFYPGKVRLILSAFHEAALMTQAVRRLCTPGGRTGLNYTTSSSVTKNKIVNQSVIKE
ncbi:NAD(P)/FAD-dependent oxidoreductase [Sinorhizobium sp. BG8]|uniref:NAD(P)/FAD-dependent oxidoreductase n=1 Tax=Sinorhizobium sp. BG8 TaxID=2613773 RepID=UPI00193EB631|nr:NAD(P)/FAD-dependent oxidoreductase [Sinorhizobium sp. BG8]QRM55665.1 NAD(P)-binding protein [Sinorhizobium sp. BG8]